MANKVKAIPDGYSSVQVYLIQTSSAKAIEFYKRAFGAEEMVRMPGPDGTVMHAEIRIGNSVVMMSDENPAMNPTAKSPEHAKVHTAGVMIYSEDVEKLWKRAVDAGAKVEMPLADQFWGDRYGQLSDPWGHRWSLAQHVEDVAPAEMEKRMAAMMQQK